MAKIVQVARFTADGSQVTREFKQMGDAGQQMANRVKQGAQGLSPSLRAIDAAAGVARDKVEGLAGSAGSMGTVLRSLGPAGLVAAAGIGAITVAAVALQAQTRNAIRDLATIESTARRVGVSTSTLQEVRFAVLGVGGAVEQADAALTQFAEKIGEATLTRSGGGFNALKAIGFTDAEIANMNDIEAALPRITQRISEMSNATEQMRVAKELGLEPLLPLLQRGEGAFDDAARAARDMGYVLDRELIARAAEFNGQWSQAAAVIDVQFKSALVDLAPIFIDLAKVIADAAGALVGFLDQFDKLEDRATRTLGNRLGGIARERAMLRERFPVRNGVDPLAGGDASQNPAAASGQIFNPRIAADRWAALNDEAARTAAIINQRYAQAERIVPATPPRAPAGGAPQTDAELARQAAFIDQLREQIRVTDALADVQARMPDLSEEEARAQFQLEEQLRRLQEARAAGAITDDELAALRASVQAHHDAAAAVRAEAEEHERLSAAREARESFLSQFDTPQDRIEQQLATAREIQASATTPEDAERAARAIEELTRQYNELAAAQFEASAIGQVLQGVVQGQIRDFDDLGRVLTQLLADAFIRELLSGSFMRGGAGGFASGFWDRLGGMITGSGKGWGGGMGIVQGEWDWMGKGRSGGGGIGSILSSVFSSIFGGGRAGGGPGLIGARHSIAEQGPELALVGGWSHIKDQSAVQGLAVLSQLSRLAQAAPAPMATSPRVTVNVANHSGTDVEAEARTSFGPNGELAVDIALTRKTANDLASGKLDSSMGRFGLRGPAVRRG